MIDADEKLESKQIFDESAHALKTEENVQCIISKVKSSGCLNECSRLQSLSGQVATPEQQTDLTGFGDVGQSMFLNRIEYFILKDPSAQVPQRKARLLTFASNKSVKKKR